MDSEDDMHDADEGASMEEEDDYYSGGDDDDYDLEAMEEDDTEDYDDSCGGVGGEDDEDDDGGNFESDADSFADVNETVSSRSEKCYAILNEEDILRRQEEGITEISTVLSISKAEACILLRCYNWSVSDVHEEWFSDEERVRKAVGLLEKPTSRRLYNKEVPCGICFESYPGDTLRSVACYHLFCDACWKAYISTSIKDGPGCLMLRCPDPSCGAAVGQDFINNLASNYDKKKYCRYLFRSFVEGSRKIKWCPAPGCDSAVECVGSENYDVSCSCFYSFCWNCTEEAHRPVDCDTVMKWILKNSAESENMNWILANSKPCPKCKRPIEKNQGCMHMTCSPPCKFEFCWLCLGGWEEHGERTGGFYACNRYESAKQEGVYDEAERRRERAKNSLEKYTHYYERWASNQSSRQKAVSDLQQMQNVHLQKLSEVQGIPESQLEYIVAAWQQIIECRRVLKWTYAYGYYLPDSEHAKKQFFEYSQGEAEAALERLHQCAEKELMNYLNADSPSNDFNDFRTKLVGLTSVTRTYFENLVRALENGLSDIYPGAAASDRTNSKNVAGSSKNKGNGKSKAHSRTGTLFQSTDDSVNWTCERCAHSNSGSVTTCQNCLRRPQGGAS